MIDSMFQEGTDRALDDQVRRPVVRPEPITFGLGRTVLGAPVRGTAAGVVQIASFASEVTGAFGQFAERLSYSLLPENNDAQRAYAHGRRVRRPGASIAVERRIGYVQAARSAGWPPERIDWIEIDDLDPDQAGAALAARRATLAAGCRVAVVAMTDRMALAGRQEAARWPDVTLAAIVGFDDIPAAAPAGLTTVRQDAHRKGRLAVQVLLDAPAAPMPPLPVALVVRDT